MYLAIYFVAINLLVLTRFWQFETFYFDHGIFDQAIWNVSRFSEPLIDHLGPTQLNQLGDHFNPAIYLISPMYWLTNSYEMIYVVENVFVVLSAFVLFLIAKHRLQNKLMIFALTISYTLFIGMQNAILADFHPELMALLPLSLTFWALEMKKKKLFWLCMLLTFGFKELFALIGIFLSIYLFFNQDRKRAVILFIVSTLYLVISIKLLIPYFANDAYYYNPAPVSLESVIPSFFLPPIKTQTMFVTFLNFGLAPLAVVSLIPLYAQDFVVRFILNSGSTRWDLGLHYNALPAVILTYGSIIGIAKLLAFKWYKKIITFHALAIIAIVLILHRFVYHGPLGLTYNKDFYAHTKNFDSLRSFIAGTPATPLTMTQNNLGPYLTHSTSVLLLRMDYWNYDPDLVVLDIREGQNPNVYWPLQEPAVKILVERLDNDPHYRKTAVTDTQLRYQKITELQEEYYQQFE